MNPHAPRETVIEYASSGTKRRPTGGEIAAGTILLMAAAITGFPAMVGIVALPFYIIGGAKIDVGGTAGGILVLALIAALCLKLGLELVRPKKKND